MSATLVPPTGADTVIRLPRSCPDQSGCHDQTHATQAASDSTRHAHDVFTPIYTAAYTVGSVIPIVGAGINGATFLRSLGESEPPESPSTGHYGFPALIATALNIGGALTLGFFDPTYSAVTGGLCLASAAMLGGIAAHNSLKLNHTLVDSPHTSPPSRGLFTPAYATVMTGLSAVPGMGGALNAAQLFRSDTRQKWGIPAFCAIAANGFGIMALCNHAPLPLTISLLGTAGLMGGIAALNAAKGHSALVGN